MSVGSYPLLVSDEEMKALGYASSYWASRARAGFVSARISQTGTRAESRCC